MKTKVFGVISRTPEEVASLSQQRRALRFSALVRVSILCAGVQLVIVF